MPKRYWSSDVFSSDLDPRLDGHAQVQVESFVRLEDRVAENGNLHDLVGRSRRKGHGAADGDVIRSADAVRERRRCPIGRAVADGYRERRALGERDIKIEVIGA